MYFENFKHELRLSMNIEPGNINIRIAASSFPWRTENSVNEKNEKGDFKFQRNFEAQKNSQTFYKKIRARENFKNSIEKFSKKILELGKNL